MTLNSSEPVGLTPVWVECLLAASWSADPYQHSLPLRSSMLSRNLQSDPCHQSQHIHHQAETWSPQNIFKQRAAFLYEQQQHSYYSFLSSPRYDDKRLPEIFQRQSQTFLTMSKPDTAHSRKRFMSCLRRRYHKQKTETKRKRYVFEVADMKNNRKPRSGLATRDQKKLF